MTIQQNRTTLTTFQYIGQIDADEKNYSTQVTVVDLGSDEIHGHQLELVFEDNTYNGIDSRRIHNYMLKNGIYKDLNLAFDNQEFGEYTVDGVRHVRLLVVEGQNDQ